MFSFVLETSGFRMILNFLFQKSLKNAFAVKLKILILRKSCFLNFQHVVLLTVQIYTHYFYCLMIIGPAKPLNFQWFCRLNVFAPGICRICLILGGILKNLQSLKNKFLVLNYLKLGQFSGSCATFCSYYVVFPQHFCILFCQPCQYSLILYMFIDIH